MQIAFDDSAAFERLSGIHGVDDLLVTYFITKTITGCTEHAGDGEILREDTVNAHNCIHGGGNNYLTACE